MKKVSRKEAQAQGLSKYFTGEACRRGHIAERYVAGACCECVSARKKEIYQERREEVLAYMKVQGAAYRAANPEKRAENSRRWKQNNPERVRMLERVRRQSNPELGRRNARAHYYRHRERELIRQKIWRMANKGVVNAFTAKRKADLLQRTPFWLSTDDLWLLQEAYLLAQQRTALTGFVWHVDHVIPLRGKKVSGLHVPTNIRVIPGLDNLRKGNRMGVA
jgi:hypothetical protein